MDGQATAPGTLDDLASFLEDQPLEESEDQEGDESTSQESQDQPDEDSDAVDDSEPTDGADEGAKDQPSDRKIQVTVKGEDGADITMDVEEKELVSGYLRQRDYTVKTQQLAERERQAFEVVTGEIEKARGHYLEHARVAMQAVQELAGFRSPEEMEALSRADPAAWVAEQQRLQLVQQRVQRIQAGMQQANAQAQQQQAQVRQAQFQKAWNVLQDKGIDREQLSQIYSKAAKEFGFSEQDFENVYDPRVVLALRDAVAYRALKNQKPEAQKRVQLAPKTPQTKQPVPRSETKLKQLDAKFKGGKAKLNDLAAYLAATS